MTTAVVSRSTVPLNEEQARMDLAGRRSALETMFTAGYEIFAFVMNKRKAHYGASTAFCIFQTAVSMSYLSLLLETPSLSVLWALISCLMRKIRTSSDKRLLVWQTFGWFSMLRFWRTGSTLMYQNFGMMPYWLSL